LPNGNKLRRDYKKGLISSKGKLLSLGGRLILINSVLTNMVLYMILFLPLAKRCFTQDGLPIVLDSFGKETARKISNDWLNGVWFVDPRISASLGCMAFMLRTQPFLVNSFLSCLLKMVCGKPY
jgi:hypothetical protein